MDYSAMPSPNDRNWQTRADAHNEPRVASSANTTTRPYHRDIENLVERPQQPNATPGLRKPKSFHHMSYIQPTESKRDITTGNQYDKPTDRENIVSVCASCKCMQKQLEESYEAIKNMEKHLGESHEAIEHKEKQLNQSYEAIENKEKQLNQSYEDIKDMGKHLDESREVIRDKEKQLDESREAIKFLEQKCRDLEYERWDLEYERWILEIDQFKNLKPKDDNAERLYEELYERLKDESRQFGQEQNQKAKLLSLYTAYVDMQIERKNYQQAEEVAKSTWEACKHEESDDSRLVYRQLCEAYRQQGSEKHMDLERLLRKTWPAGETHQSLLPWTLENGDELCSVLELNGDFESAYALRLRLWKEREKEQGKWHKDTVRTGIWASQCKVKQHAALEKTWTPAKKAAAHENAMETAKEIWELWDPHQPSEADVGILTGGHLLGYLHYCQRAYEDARRVLEVVWKERKALLIQSPEDTMLTGHYLSQTYFQVGDRSKANSVFEEVWNVMKFTRRETCENRVLKAYHLSIDCLGNRSTTGTENNSVPENERGHLPLETLKAWFEIGWAVLNQEKYQDAVCILQQVYDTYRAVPGVELHHEDIFTCGRYLGEAIAKQGKGYAEATTILETILEEQTRHETKNEFEVLECRHLYGCLLKELAESQSTSSNELLQKAVKELKTVWQARYNTSPPRLDRPRLLEAGYCLTSALIGLLKIPEAHRVLEEVWELEEKGPEKNAVESLAFCHSLGISLMDLGKDNRVTNEAEMTTQIFQRVWDTRKGPTRWAGILKDGYYLGCCRMKLQQYSEAKDVLEEVEKMIAEAEARDLGSLMKAVQEALAECKGLVEKPQEVRRGDRRRRGNGG